MMPLKKTLHPRNHAPGRRRGPRDPEKARQQLLQAALHLFAERGFSAVNVREIARSARVSPAAINYYFGGKVELRMAAIRHAFAHVKPMHQQMVAMMRTLDGTNAAQALTDWIRIVLEHQARANRDLWLIMSRELLAPSEALPLIVEEFIRPQAAALASILQKLADNAPPQKLGMLASSIMGQCIHFTCHRAIGNVLSGRAAEEVPWPLAQVRAHITEFSLAGIRQASGGQPV